MPPSIPLPIDLRTCSIAAAAKDPRLKKVYASIINVDSNEVLYGRNPQDPAPTGSMMKIMTAAAAIAAFGPDYRLTTKVVEGATPGTIVLVGGGDPTLTRLGPGQQSVYSGAPKLSDLAAQTLTAYNAAHPGVPITNVVVDDSMWSDSDSWDPSWSPSLQTGGYVSKVTALQVDGDRQDPRSFVSPRSNDPVGRAGQAFVTALGLTGVSVTTGVAENGATTLASVKSAQMKSLVFQMLQLNDNTLAETLARATSVKESLGGSAASLQQAITNGILGYGADTNGITAADGSGLSANDKVPADVMARFMGIVGFKKNGMQYVFAGLSVPGKAGLIGRFTGANAVLGSHLWAKAGQVGTSYSLSGFMKANDGTHIGFALYAVGSGISSSAIPALDNLTAAVFKCGNNLSSL
jgi:D-alanyl-D-alanine carboxypeptidase/D-alanyl-D-alanine-endopeptidase (penicillin-binding protein 4)